MPTAGKRAEREFQYQPGPVKLIAARTQAGEPCDVMARYVAQKFIARAVQVIGKREHPVTEPPVAQEPPAPDVAGASPEQPCSGFFLLSPLLRVLDGASVVC